MKITKKDKPITNAQPTKATNTNPKINLNIVAITSPIVFCPCGVNVTRLDELARNSF